MRKTEIQPSFLGGGLPQEKPLKLAPGWRFSTDGSPGPDFQIERCSVFTTPSGEKVTLYKWSTRSAVVSALRERVERLRMEILREDAEAINRADRRLLDQKNMLTRSAPKKRGRKKGKKNADK